MLDFYISSLINSDLSLIQMDQALNEGVAQWKTLPSVHEISQVLNKYQKASPREEQPFSLPQGLYICDYYGRRIDDEHPESEGEIIRKLSMMHPDLLQMHIHSGSMYSKDLYEKALEECCKIREKNI